jgi:hypothetical protein
MIERFIDIREVYNFACHFFSLCINVMRSQLKNSSKTMNLRNYGDLPSVRMIGQHLKRAEEFLKYVLH